VQQPTYIDIVIL